jgi:PAS domain S-box-containing protein
LVKQEFLESLVDVEDLYQNAPCGYFSFLPDGTVIKLNRTLLRWLGYAEEEILNRKKFSDLISKGGIIYYEMFYLALLKMQGYVNEVNYEIRKKDGTTFPALINSSTLKDPSGELLAINATVVDITDRKKYETELLTSARLAEAEKKRFEFVTDLIPQIIWTATADGRIDYLNLRAYKYFNIEKSAISDFDVLQYIHPDDHRKAMSAWAKSLKSTADFQVQVRLKNAAGEYEWHLVRALPYYDDQGNLAKWYGSCTNIHQNILELQRKDEFIQIASHELKTPITSLKAYNQLQMRTESIETMKGFAQKSATTLNNLQFLISSLLDFSKISLGKLSLDVEKTLLSGIANHVAELLAVSYPSHKIISEIPEEDTFVMCDPHRITQVLINLLNNAIKYSPKADKVCLRLKKIAGNCLRIEVEDFGIGIPKEKLERIFDKYYRVIETKDNNRASGLGLGLYIIQNIVTKHGSRIYAESELGKGSLFYFDLPIEPSN